MPTALPTSNYSTGRKYVEDYLNFCEIEMKVLFTTLLYEVMHVYQDIF